MTPNQNTESRARRVETRFSLIGISPEYQLDALSIPQAVSNRLRKRRCTGEIHPGSSSLMHSATALINHEGHEIPRRRTARHSFVHRRVLCGEVRTLHPIHYF